MLCPGEKYPKHEDTLQEDDLNIFELFITMG
jgi:hypothetical protein